MSFSSFFRQQPNVSQSSVLVSEAITDEDDNMTESGQNTGTPVPDNEGLAQAPLDDLESQSRLRKEMLDIQNDLTTSDKQKAVLMQTLMTRNFVALSYRRPMTVNQEIGHPLSALDLAKTYHDEAAGTLGCAHYQRNCKLQCSTCFAWATCRFCHNEEHTDHELVRTATKNMLCMHCTTIQPAAQLCANPECGKRMALYYCSKCKLWDDDANKHIYHCVDCGICRVGHGLGKDFFHCDRCNVCMAMALKDSHRCIEHSTECDCPICGEYMFNSTATVVFMTCGHSIHQKCYHEHVKSNYKCPTCSKSLRNMDSLFRQLDHQIAGQPMPVPYETWKAKILCNDCSSRSTVPYHFLGAKCLNCLSYNTVELNIIRPTENPTPMQE